MSIKTPSNWIILLILPLAVSACTFTPPKTQAFVDASSALKNASQTSFQELNNSFLVIENAGKNGQCDTRKDANVDVYIQKYKERLASVQAIEAVHIAVFDAVGSYAKSLNGIVQSAESENAKIRNLQATLDNAFTQIGNNADKAGPYGPGVVAGAQLLTAVNGLVARIRQDINNWQALRSLGEAIKKSGTAIADLNTFMGKDFSSYGDLAKSKIPAFKLAFETCHRTDYDYYRVLQAARIKTANEINRYGYTATGPDWEKQTAGGAFGGKYAAVINSINQQLQFAKPQYDAWAAQELATVNRLEMIPQVFAKGRDTLDALAKAHEDLGQQLEKGVIFDFAALKSYADQLKTVVNDVNKLQSTLP